MSADLARGQALPKNLTRAGGRLTCPCEECGAAPLDQPPPRCSFFRCGDCETWTAKTAKHSEVAALAFPCRRCLRETMHARCGTDFEAAR